MRFPACGIWIVLVLCGACQTSFCTPAPEPGYRYILPEGFKGCVRIEMGVDGGAPLPRWDGFAVVEVKRRGQRFRTSDAVGLHTDRIANEVWARADGGWSKGDGAVTRSWTEQEVGGALELVLCFGGADSDE